MKKKHWFSKCILILVCGFFSLDLLGQTDPPENQEDTAPTVIQDDSPVTGGVVYNPIKDPVEGTFRDPFKSPFDLAKEKAEANKRNLRVDDGRNQYSVTELQLKGIYLEARTGYWAIFEIGGKYDWFQSGTKFQDGDLVNIDDESVLIKQFIDDESQEMAHREIRYVLHRGEE